jgi:hypothetical protein
VPERRVDREVRPEREDERDDDGEPEEEREPPAGRADEDDDAGDREQRREPADVDEALAREDARRPRLEPIHEIAPVGLEALDFRERATSRLRRAGDDRVADDEAHGDGRRRAQEHPRERSGVEPHGGVREHERHRAEGEVHLPRERYRHERSRRERAPGVRDPTGVGRTRALDREEAERQQNRDPPEEVAAALHDPVRGDREREPSERRGRLRHVERTKPAVGEEAGGDDAAEEEEIPCHDGPEGEVERPEGQAEGPAAEHRLLVDERLEAVRVAPGRGATGELVTDEPEAVDGLQVVAGRGLAVARLAVGDERRAEGANRGPRRDDGRADVEGGDSS